MFCNSIKRNCAFQLWLKGNYLQYCLKNIFSFINACLLDCIKNKLQVILMQYLVLTYQNSFTGRAVVNVFKTAFYELSVPQMSSDQVCLHLICDIVHLCMNTKHL